MGIDLSKVDFNSLASNDSEVEDVVNQEKKHRAAITTREAMKVNPDEQARINKLSQESGIPAQAVQSNPDAIETDLKFENVNFDSMVRLHPGTARLMSNYDTAAVAHDDVEPLENIEDMVGDKNNYMTNLGLLSAERAVGLGANMAAGYGSTAQGRGVEQEEAPAGTGIIGRVFELAGAKLAEKARGLFGAEETDRVGNIKQEWENGNYFNAMIEVAKATPEVTAQSIPDMGAAVLNPAGYLTGRTYEMASNRALNDGRLEVSEEDLNSVAPFAAASVVLERILPKKIIDGLGGEVVDEFGKVIVGNIAKRITADAAIEGTTEAFQSVLEYTGERFGTEAKLNLAELGEEMFFNALLGATSGGLISSVAETGKVTAAVTNKQKIDNRTEIEEQYLDNLAEKATESKLRERDPKTFKQFVEEADGENNTHVFIDGVQTSLYLSGKNVTNDPALELLSKNVAEAAQLGVDVSIPVADFATMIAPSQHFSELRPFMTMSDQTQSQFRKEESDKAQQKYVEDLIAEAQDNTSSYIEAQQIYDTVRQQLVDSGRVNDRSARVMAEVVPAWATVHARKNNISVQEAYERSGLVIKGPETEDITPPEIAQSQIESRIGSAESSTDRRVKSDTTRGEFPSGLNLNEKLQQKERGYYDPDNSLIRLTEASDLSTFLHEFAHFIYETEMDTNSDTIQSVNRWFKRNRKEVTKEANQYLGKEGHLEQPVFHGTPHIVDKFTTAAIGSGEGTLYYGWGLYFTGRKKLADQYAEMLSKGRGGNVLEADIPEDSQLLDWDKRIDEQPEIMEALQIKEKNFYLPTELRPDMDGQEVYDALANGETNRGITSKKEASLYLNNLGIPGLRYFGESSQNFVIWDDSKIQINDPMLAQSEDVPDFREPIPDNTPIVEEDVDAFLDNGTTGNAGKDSAIRRATHEQFARGFETYLMEGKAPSIELRNAFKTFARWLTQIYRAVRGNLNVSLDNEMRQVFDRLLATEEQIAAAEARAQYEPMFSDAAMAGMTEEQFTKYQNQVEKVKDKQSETLRDKMMEEITRTTRKWWKDERQDIIDEKIEELSDNAVYRAREGLKSGEFKLERSVVKELVGVEREDSRGRKSVRIPGQLNGMTATGGTGIHPDEAAVFYGYNSGAELLNDIVNAESLKDAATREAESIMIERHGDILNDGTIEQLADDAVQNEERGDLMVRELKALRQGTSAPKIDKAAIKSLAEDNIGKLSFRSIHPGKYRKAEIRAAQEAATALATGDRETAAQAKLRQVMNYYLGMEATRAKNETTKIVDRMARYNKKKVREEIQKAENGYWEQITKILDRFEFRKSVPLRQVDEQNVNINLWAKERMDTDGDALILSAAILDESYVTHWKNVPFSDLQGVNDSVKNIEHVARYSNRMTRMGEEIEFKKLVQRWTDSMNEKVKTRFKSQRTDVVEGKKWGRWAMAQMTKIPYLTSWLDGGERAGLSHAVLMQPFTDAAHAEQKLWKEVGNKVLTALDKRSKEDIKRHNSKLFIPEIKDENNNGNVMGHQVLAVALNTGNQSNLKKLLLGEGWANPDDDSAINMDNPQLKAVLSHMTKSDWELVQLIWDQMDQLYPQLAEVHRRTTGLTPPKVEASPIETEFGTFKGGYYPVKYDPNRDHKAEQNEDKLNSQVESMFSTIGSIQASVNASATNERTKYYAPIRLNLDVVSSHFQETIHYITHHDPVREVNKLIRNKEVADTIKAKLGPEEYAQLKPWLNDIAKDGRETPVRMYWDDLIGKLRFGITLGTMGFRASTGLMQLLGLSNTVAEVGGKAMMKSVKSILADKGSIKSAWDFAKSNSKVLEHRTKTMDREIKNAMSRIQGKRGMIAAMQEVSMKHIAYIQTYSVDLPSWYAGYIKKLDETGDEQQAFRYADWVIENVQGSGATKDMAAIMRGQSETSRMLTMFMTFFSSLWNMERDLIKGAKSGYYSPTSVAAKGMFIFVIPVIAEMLLRGELENEDEELDAEMIALKTALYPVQSIPFIRDIASGVGGGYGYNISPVAQLLEAGIQSAPRVAEGAVTDEEITRSQAKSATRLAGAAFGVPGVSQAWATGEHLYEVLEEGEELTTRELLFGPKRE